MHSIVLYCLIGNDFWWRIKSHILLNVWCLWMWMWEGDNWNVVWTSWRRCNWHSIRNNSRRESSDGGAVIILYGSSKLSTSAALKHWSIVLMRKMMWNCIAVVLWLNILVRLIVKTNLSVSELHVCRRACRISTLIVMPNILNLGAWCDILRVLGRQGCWPILDTSGSVVSVNDDWLDTLKSIAVGICLEGGLGNSATF